ncbi:HNH endonuclease family protein [Tsukamurella pulmonis]|uniref:HNH endonuclease family protein n=1 Tax=Tsukamurella pulmonis TaxID=47312 RepID=UPI001FB1F260|nr:HNH endonuclease family protein [Tsukamurella pulmonis]
MIAPAVARWVVGCLITLMVTGCSVRSIEQEEVSELATTPAPNAINLQSHPSEPTDKPAAHRSGTAAPGTPVSGARSAALSALEHLAVKGRAPKTGYSRSQFGIAWTDANTTLWGGDSLSTRENILSRDLTDIACKTPPERTSPPCVIQSGVLNDPYTGTTLNFVRGEKTSPLIPIDHTVSLGDAFQKGAQQLSLAERTNLANDPLNLIATTREPNSAKGDSDAASWLPPNKTFRCKYVARQIAVKIRYRLWVTQPEKDAIARVLSSCPGQRLPTAAEEALRVE